MRKCLIIDDQEFNLVITQQMLEQLGFEVDTISSPVMAQPYLQAEHYDLVMVDWFMPGMDGLEFIKRLRRTEAGKQTVTFLYSSEQGKDGIYKAMNAMADGFIPKPITMEKMSRELRRAGIV